MWTEYNRFKWLSKGILVQKLIYTPVIICSVVEVTRALYKQCMDNQSSFESRAEDILAVILQKISDLTDEVRANRDEMLAVRKNVRSDGKVLAEV
jgi:hypothetical protein